MKLRKAFFLGMIAMAGMLSLLVAYGLLWHPPLAPYEPRLAIGSGAKGNKLQVTFMGVSTILVGDPDTSIMTDGFFSRPGKLDVLTGPVIPHEKRIDDALSRLGPDRHRLDAVFVSHTHYDHALDSARVARLEGATLYGSESAEIIARKVGLGDVRELVAGKAEEVGKNFHVTPYKSPHSQGRLLAFPGEVPSSFSMPGWICDYREGGSYSFLIERRGPDGRTAPRILIHPSANFSKGMYSAVGADVVFLGIARLGRQDKNFVADYWREVVVNTGAKLVVPVHWDDFLLSLDEPLRPMPPFLDDFGRGMHRICSLAARDGVSVQLLRAFEQVDVDSLLKPRPRDSCNAHSMTE